MTFSGLPEVNSSNTVQGRRGAAPDRFRLHAPSLLPSVENDHVRLGQAMCEKCNQTGLAGTFPPVTIAYSGRPRVDVHVRAIFSPVARFPTSMCSRPVPVVVPQQ
jgi:hypothetical protein